MWLQEVSCLFILDHTPNPNRTAKSTARRSILYDSFTGRKLGSRKSQTSYSKTQADTKTSPSSMVSSIPPRGSFQVFAFSGFFLPYSNFPALSWQNLHVSIETSRPYPKRDHQPQKIFFHNRKSLSQNWPWGILEFQVILEWFVDLRKKKAKGIKSKIC